MSVGCKIWKEPVDKSIDHVPYCFAGACKVHCEREHQQATMVGNYGKLFVPLRHDDKVPFIIWTQIQGFLLYLKMLIGTTVNINILFQMHIKRIRGDRKYSKDIFSINFRNIGWKGTIWSWKYIWKICSIGYCWKDRGITILTSWQNYIVCVARFSISIKFTILYL